MQYEANTTQEYIDQLPDDRKAPITRIKQILSDHLPKGFKEGIGYKMIAFSVPLSVYPKGYHCNPETPLPFINLASQKNFIALYHMGLYAKKELLDWFVSEYPKHSKYKLDMGKSCVRFKKIDDIPYDLIAALAQKMTVEDWIEIYENAFKKK